MSLELTTSCDELRNRFFALQTREDVAILLDVEDKRLRYHLYGADLSHQYTRFTIPKASGGSREILAPTKALKILQRKLAQVLQCVHQARPSAHGFMVGKSIVTNAKEHTRKKYVLNLDLKDFFPSINFGRVRGMFLASPYNCTGEVATVLAQICCYDNHLPQGAPTSPIVSNMICTRMDRELQQLAKQHKCDYSRYADDITFSTSRSSFPTELAVVDETKSVSVGEELQRIINSNGFELNYRKVRLQTQSRRQEVTGLTVNRFPNVKRKYVRQVRAMLHAWEKYGLEAAEGEFLANYDRKYRGPYKNSPSFKQVVKGKIDFLGMVRGKSDLVYLRLLRKYADLDPDFVLREPILVPTGGRPRDALIFTEGKTDWKHLKNAVRKLKALGRMTHLGLEFHEYEENIEMGDQELLTMCRTYSKSPQSKPTIFIFDRDKSNIVSQVTGSTTPFKDWGNNVFSFALPIPDHRKDTPEISIEFYYSDDEIRRKDKNARRLFVNNEFNPRSGRHLSADLNCADRNKYGRDTICVIDHDVFDRANQNVALPKADFAENVLKGVPGFHDFDVSQFEKIFSVIAQILKTVDKSGR